MEFVEFMRAFGFPAGCLVALSVALWRAITYVGPKLIALLTLLVERIIKFIDGLDTKLDSIEKAISSGLNQQTASLGKKLDNVKDSVTSACKIAHENSARQGNPCEPTDVPTEPESPMQHHPRQIQYRPPSAVGT